MDEDELFGLFQTFRPHGVGVEFVFAGLPDRMDYVARLLPVYAATSDKVCAEDIYFVVRSVPPFDERQACDAGRRFVAELRHLAAVIGDPELSRYLASVADVEVVPGAVDRMNDDHLLVYERVGDWINQVSDHEDRIPQLDEAYYSIACDYWLAYYLQWPYFTRWCDRDVFRPYFDLWRLGLSCGFQGPVLRIWRCA